MRYITQRQCATYPNMKYLEVAYCLLNSPNVGLLLFMATLVVLLLVLTIRTMFTS